MELWGSCSIDMANKMVRNKTAWVLSICGTATWAIYGRRVRGLWCFVSGKGF